MKLHKILYLLNNIHKNYRTIQIISEYHILTSWTLPYMKYNICNGPKPFHNSQDTMESTFKLQDLKLSIQYHSCFEV